MVGYCVYALIWLGTADGGRGCFVCPRLLSPACLGFCALGDLFDCTGERLSRSLHRSDDIGDRRHE